MIALAIAPQSGLLPDFILDAAADLVPAWHRMPLRMRAAFYKAHPAPMVCALADAALDATGEDEARAVEVLREEWRRAHETQDELFARRAKERWARAGGK